MLRHSPSAAGCSWGSSSPRNPLTLDADAELAAGSVVGLVVGGVADHMLTFREFRAGLRAPQHHPDPTDGFLHQLPGQGAPGTALAGSDCSTSVLTS